MTELEKIKYAKIFIDKLADGINPLDDTVISQEDIVNNVRISRCFFYVSDILRQVIENGGVVSARKTKKTPFSLSADSLSEFEYSDAPIAVSEIARRISALKSGENMSNLSYKDITAWLIEIGLLYEKANPVNGKMTKLPTQQGCEIGISTEVREGRYGNYTVVLYDRSAQEFILDNFDGLMMFRNSK